MFALLSIQRAKSSWETLRNRESKHCGNTKLSNVLIRGFREVGEIVVRIVDEHRVIIHENHLVELLGLITCDLHLIWPGSQTSRCKCGETHVLRFQDGKIRQDHVDGVVSEVVVGIGLEVTVQEQQRRVNHEIEERRDGEIKDARANTFFMTLKPCVYVHTHGDVRRQTVKQKNVRATSECVHTTRRTHCSCCYVCTKP